MLKEERQQLILKILDEEQKVIVSDLKMRLSVSEDTIRRDLKELDGLGLVKRVHSGALKIGPAVSDFEQRQSIDPTTKEILAHHALPFLKENSIIIIDGSTTNLKLVESLPTDFKATIITNSPIIAFELSKFEFIETIMLGGKLEKRSIVNLGIETIETLNTIRADLYIAGVHNIDSDHGITVHTQLEAQVKYKMGSVSNEILAMATKDKIETVSNFVCTEINDITHLITEKLPVYITDKYRDKNIQVIN